MSTIKGKPAAQAGELKDEAPELKDEAPELKGNALGALPLDLVNPGTTPVGYDLVGHTLDAGGRVSVVSVDKIGRRAVRNAYLLCQDAEDTWISFAADGSIVARPIADAERAALARGASNPE